MRTCIRAYAHTYMCVGIHVCTYVHKDSTHTLTYTSTCIHNHEHMHSQIHTCTYVYLHSHMCTPSCPFKCMYTHTQHTPCLKLFSCKHNRHRIRAISQQSRGQDDKETLLASYRNRWIYQVCILTGSGWGTLLQQRSSVKTLCFDHRMD